MESAKEIDELEMNMKESDSSTDMRIDAALSQNSTNSIKMSVRFFVHFTLTPSSM